MAISAQWDPATKLGSIGPQSFPDLYAGVEQVGLDGAILYVTRNDETQIGDLLGAASVDRSSVQVVVVQHSYEALNKLAETITNDPKWDSGAAKWTSVGPDVKTNKVRVTLTQYSAEAAALYTSEYGSDWVVVSPDSAPLPQRYSSVEKRASKWDKKQRQIRLSVINRENDTAPYLGGDLIWFIQSGQKNYCTSGIPVQRNEDPSKVLMTTAAHCDEQQVAVNTNKSSPRIMGRIKGYRFNDGGLDSAIIGGSYAGRVWANSSPTYGIRGGKNPYGGAEITFDGAFTGEINNVTIQRSGPDNCVRFADGVKTCYLGTATKTAVTVCQPGDSGGPVFQRYSGGGVWAVGTIVGGSGSTCYYQRMVDINNYFNTSVLKGIS